MNTLFHLAFPIHDFELAKHFYHEKLGCQLGRESEHALIFKLGPHQMVGHKVENPVQEQETIYPRHFGLIFLELAEFNDFIERLKDKHVPFHIQPKTRFPKTRLEHQSFFLKDPSNNLLEFKYYSHFSAIFGEKEFHEIGDKT